MSPLKVTNIISNHFWNLKGGFGIKIRKKVRKIYYEFNYNTIGMSISCFNVFSNYHFFCFLIQSLEIDHVNSYYK